MEGASLPPGALEEQGTELLTALRVPLRGRSKEIISPQRINEV